MKAARRKKRILWTVLTLVLGVGAAALALRGTPSSNEIGNVK